MYRHVAQDFRKEVSSPKKVQKDKFKIQNLFYTISPVQYTTN